MEPVFGGQVEVARGTDVDRRRTHFARDVDAAFHVGEVQRAIGVADLAAHIQVLRATWGSNGAEAAVDAVGFFGECVLRDANHALAALTGFFQALFVEIGGARIQRDQCAIQGVHTAGLADTHVVDFKTKRGRVGDGDVGLVMGQQATGFEGHIDGSTRAGVRRNIDETR